MEQNIGKDEALVNASNAESASKETASPRTTQVDDNDSTDSPYQASHSSRIQVEDDYFEDEAYANSLNSGNLHP